MLRPVAFLSALTFMTAPALAAGLPASDRVGDTYEIRLEAKGESFGPGFSSRSTTTGGVVERVVAIGEESVELVYDFPASETAGRRAQDWRLPAHVRRDRDGKLTLLNGPELQGRVDAWLRRSGYTNADCGRWIIKAVAPSTPAPNNGPDFIKVICDPQSVLKLVARYDLRFTIPLGRNAGVRDPDAMEEAYVVGDAKGSIYSLDARLDPEVIRRKYAEEDVRTAKVAGDADTLLNNALKQRAADRIVGAISGSYETDDQGQVTRKLKTIIYTLERPNGEVIASSETETMTRRRISP
jgi:hypothetical protein